MSHMMSSTATKPIRQHGRLAVKGASLKRQRRLLSRPLLIMLSICLVSLLLLPWTSWARSGKAKVVVDFSSTVGLATQTTTSYRPIFTVASEFGVGQNILPNIRDPKAVDAQKSCPGYKASHITQTRAGFTAFLDLAGPACNVYGNDVENLTLTVEYQATDRLLVQIQPRYLSPDNETWFILPEALIPKPASTDGTSQQQPELTFSWSNEPTFSFSVKRNATSDVLFSTNGTVLVYEDQFIEFVSALPDNYNLYGLGEVIHGFRLGNNLTRTLFAADIGDPVDENLYGSHPFYLDTRYFTQDNDKLTYVDNATDTSVRYQSYSHGVYLRNAHAQEILLKPNNITWRSLGGTIELYFYAGPAAHDVTQAYQQTAVGLPAMHQYWTLGFHQCRWGYQNWTVLAEVVDEFAKAGIPLETIWTDIDYMNQYRDFENDQRTFSYEEAISFLEKLHANDQHYIPIVDSAIYSPNPENVSDAYPTYDRGLAANAFMLNPDGSLYVGEVWPGYTVYPDWIGAVLNDTGTFKWWSDELKTWYEKIKFDGIWIDMSEVSSFCVGSCGSKNLTLNPVHPSFGLPGEPNNLVLSYPEGFNLTNATEAASASQASSAQASATSTSSSSTSTQYLRTSPTPGSRNINWPPYAINNVQGDLAVHAVSPNATHHGGAVEYDYHNLFGHQILNATYQALLSIFPTKRPFVIGRSTFAGSGKWAGHWGGDNASFWYYLFFSIPQALSFSLFGIPMFGVDTCGFGGNSDLELCSRWMQLSAFFPFYRNHNTLGSIPQEPYRWAAVAEASRTAMAIRYRLLPYMYTLLAHAHHSGSTVLRALSWEFPQEPWLANADRQFLVGPSLMVIPCLVQGASTVGGVFPGAGQTIWYDWYNHTAVNQELGPAQNVTIAAPLGHIPVYIRGGYIIPLQEAAMTTTKSRSSPWSLIVALDNQGQATGDLYLDDGESLNPNATTWVNFSASKSTLTSTPTGNFNEVQPLANVTILGVPTNPKTVTIDGTALNPSCWIYTSETRVLSISDLQSRTMGGAWKSTGTIDWS